MERSNLQDGAWEGPGCQDARRCKLAVGSERLWGCCDQDEGLERPLDGRSLRKPV